MPTDYQHRFIDEMGDTCFYGKRRRPLVGHEGVSLSFGLGSVKIKGNLEEIRQEVISLQKEVEIDPLFNTLPSVVKRMSNKGFFFHACKDTPDVRAIFMRYIRNLDCTAQVVVARKSVERFERKHKSKDSEFYADLLSHIIKDQMKKEATVVLNIAERGSSTKAKVLNQALEIAKRRAIKKFNQESTAKIVFNVQTPHTEPLLNIADYLCWTVQRVFEQGDMRYYDYLKDKIRLIVDLYDTEKYEGFGNYYEPKKKPLTSENRLTPPCT